MKKQLSKILILVGLIILLGGFFYFDLQNYLSFSYIKAQQNTFSEHYQQNPLLSLCIFFTIYVLVASLSVPGAVPLTLIAGALFGFTMGTIVVSFASSLGATIAFLASRFLFRDSIQNKFSEQLKKINHGIEKEGALYLFTMRLVPIFPFFMINLVMGLTPLKTWQFYVASQVGMLAGTAVYVNAGTQLASLNSPSEILNFNTILSFALLGIFPVAANKLVKLIQNKQKKDI